MKQVFIAATVALTVLGNLSHPFPPEVGTSEVERNKTGRKPMSPSHVLDDAAGKRSLQLEVASGASFPNCVRETCNDVYIFFFFFFGPPGLVTYILSAEK